MKDPECIALLRWALPLLGLRWAGFRKVRRQVCRRIDKRLRQLGLEDIDKYRHYLKSHTEELSVLDGLCRITISRFYRDRGVFDALEHSVLPKLIRSSSNLGASELRIWSAGCGSGEEAYTLAMMWRFCFAPHHPHKRMRIQGTDADSQILSRARRACYPPSSLKELPNIWRENAFCSHGDQFCLLDEFKTGTDFLQQDIRHATPHGPFHIVMCRNLVFTYFAHELQRKILDRLARALHDGGALVVGAHENLPGDHPELSEWLGKNRIFMKYRSKL